MNQMPILGFPWSRRFCWEGFFFPVHIGHGAKVACGQMYKGIISQTGWWFHAFVYFHPYFSNGLKPPTSKP